MRLAHKADGHAPAGRASIRKLGAAAALGLCLTAAGGCASARLTQFDSFAEAGRAYAKASRVVLDEAGSAAIDADSVVALRGREVLDANGRREHLVEQDKLLSERLLLLRQISGHARLLESYFEALQALATTEAPESAGAAAKGVFDSIAKLSPTIRDASIGAVKVEPLIQPATSFVVGRLKAKALEAELQARSKAVERELALQEAALTAVTRDLGTDLLARLNGQRTDLARLYASDAKLGDDWIDRRRQLLLAQASAQSAGQAADAAAQLRSSFVALVEGRLTKPSLESVLASINSVLDLVDQIRKVESEG